MWLWNTLSLYAKWNTVSFYAQQRSRESDQPGSIPFLATNQAPPQHPTLAWVAHVSNCTQVLTQNDHRIFIFTDVEIYDNSPRESVNICYKEPMICAVYSPIVLKWPFHEAWMWVRFQLACGRGNGRVVLLVSVLYAPRNVYQDIKARTHAWDSGTN